MRLAIAVGFLGLFSATGMADEASRPKLGEVFYPDAVRFVTSVSEDREVATMMFDNFSLATASGKAPLVTAQTKPFSISNSLESKGDAVATLDVRGFVDVQDGGSAALIIHAGGETTVVDLKKAVTAETTKPRKTEDALYTAAKENAETAGFRNTIKSAGGANFYARVSVDIAKGQAMQATMLLLVDRVPATGSSAMITVDSLDIAVKAAPRPKANGDSEKKTEVTKVEKVKLEKDSDASRDDAKPEKKVAAKRAGRKTEAKKTEAKKTAAEKPAVEKSAVEKSAVESAGEEPTAAEPAAEKSADEESSDELMEEEPVAAE